MLRHIVATCVNNTRMNNMRQEYLRFIGCEMRKELFGIAVGITNSHKE